MKIRIYTRRICAIFFLAILSGCTDFLTTEPQDFISPENYYKTEEEVYSALGATYRTLGDLNCYGQQLAYEALIDDLGYWDWKSTPSNMINRVYSWNYTSSQSDIKKIWDNLYSGINRANELLENIDKADMDNGLRETYRNEALFLRAYFHFLLVSNWGDIPLKLTSTTSAEFVNIACTPQEEVLQKVVDDMEDVIASETLVAADKLDHAGRVTQTVAQGILARVYLKMAGAPINKGRDMYEKALFYAQEVEKSTIHRLNDSYSQIFINHAQNVYDKDFRECMWEAQFYGNSVTDPGKSTGYSYIGNRIGIESKNEDVIGYGYAYVRARLNFIDLYDDSDVRKERNIATYIYDSKGKKTNVDIFQRCIGKWRREDEVLFPKHKNNTPTNFPILRYADVLLMIAEAENEVNGLTEVAYDAINAVRKRAGIVEYTIENGNRFTTSQDFKQAVMDERARELCFEGLRKFDLVRWGIYVQEMNNAARKADTDSRAGSAREKMTEVAKRITDRYIYFPIPQSELQLNKLMTQNKGW